VNLHQFIMDNVPNQELGDGEIITHAVVIYLKVTTMGPQLDFAEKCDYSTSNGCGKILSKGMVVDILDQWSMDEADDRFKDGDDDGPT